MHFTSCNNLPSAKSPTKIRIEISDTPAQETIIEPKNAVHGSYNNNNLGKDKSSIDITRTNLIPPIMQKRKMRRNRRKYKMGKKT